MELTSREISWDHIYQLHLFQKDRELKYAPHLTLECFEFKTSFAKMNVPTAVKTLSRDVAAGLRLLVKKHGYPADFLTTALFCDFFGRWVNFITSRGAVCLSYKDMEKYNECIEFLQEFMLFFDSIEFGQKGRQPFQAGLILCTTTIMEIAKECLDSGDYEYFIPSRISSAPNETLFSIIRSKNVSPSAYDVQCHLKVYSFKAMAKLNKAGSYLMDEDGESNSWNVELKQLKAIDAQRAASDHDGMVFAVVDNFQGMDYSQVQALSDVVGYVLAKTICGRSYCKHCCEVLTTKVLGLEIHSSLEEKEYSEGSKTRPTELALKVLSLVESSFLANRNSFSKKPRSMEKFIETMKVVVEKDFKDFPVCHLELIIRRFLKCRQQFWANQLDALVKEHTKHEKDGDNYGSRSLTFRALRS